MKILKYLLYAIIGLVVIFFAIGLIKSSVNYGHEITVNKPIKEAWAVTQDQSKYAQWLEGFKSMELISGEEGVVGSKYKVIVNPGEGQADFEMIETLVDIKEFDYVKMDFDSEAMEFKQTISFKENDGKTTVKTDSKVIGKGIMSRSIFAIMETLGGAFTAQETKNIEALKKVIEENKTDYYAVPEKELDSKEKDPE